MPTSFPKNTFKLPTKGLNIILALLLFTFFFLPIVTLFMSLGALAGSLLSLAVGPLGILGGVIAGGVVGIVAFIKIMQGVTAFNTRFIHSLEHIESEIDEQNHEFKPSSEGFPLKYKKEPIVVDVKPLESEPKSTSKSQAPKF